MNDEYIFIKKEDLRDEFLPILIDTRTPQRTRDKVNEILKKISKEYPIKRGSWAEVDDSYWTCDYRGIKINPKSKYRHEECGKVTKERSVYCPECGAKML